MASCGIPLLRPAFSTQFTPCTSTLSSPSSTLRRRFSVSRETPVGQDRAVVPGWLRPGGVGRQLQGQCSRRQAVLHMIYRRVAEVGNWSEINTDFREPATQPDEDGRPPQNDGGAPGGKPSSPRSRQPAAVIRFSGQSPRPPRWTDGGPAARRKLDQNQNPD